MPPKTCFRNPSKAEKQAYKEQKIYSQVKDLYPQTQWQIKSENSNDLLYHEFDEETRLNGSKLMQYFKDGNKLG